MGFYILFHTSDILVYLTFQYGAQKNCWRFLPLLQCFQFLLHKLSFPNFGAQDMLIDLETMDIRHFVRTQTASKPNIELEENKSKNINPNQTFR